MLSSGVTGVILNYREEIGLSVISPSLILLINR